MKKLKKWVKRCGSLVVVACVLSQGATITKAETKRPEINGEYGIAFNMDTGEVLYSKNADKKAYPASITKIMTAILVMENMKPEEKITASKEAVGQIGSNSQFKLIEGEKLTRNMALDVMMIKSANDVAYGFAEKIGGTVEEFGEMMTKKAKEIGAKNTHFTSPNGLHDPNHYTTAHDMALITNEAAKYPEIIRAMEKRSETIKTDQRSVKVTATNKVNTMENAIAGKTGYTDAARNTLSTIFEKGGKRIITVVMKTNPAGEYSDSLAMSKYAFSELEPKTLVNKGETLGEVELYGKKIDVQAAESVVMYQKDDTFDKFEQKIVLNEDLPRKVEKGKVVGEAVLKLATGIEKNVTIVSAETVINKQTIKTQVNAIPKAKTNMPLLLFVIIAPFVFYVFFAVKLAGRKTGRRQLERGSE